jgi:hypothetical protein
MLYFDFLFRLDKPGYSPVLPRKNFDIPLIYPMFALSQRGKWRSPPEKIPYNPNKQIHEHL